MAATIAVLRFERELTPNEDYNVTSRRVGLEYLLDVIARSARTMPGLERSDAIMRKRMKGVVDTHLSTHHALSPNSIAQQSASIAPSSDQIVLAQTTAFQQISNPGIGHVYQPTEFAVHQPASSDTTMISAISTPRYSITESQTLSGQMPLPAFVDEFLPAFPGQQFPVGSDYTFGNTDFDPQARMALMGYNLDPHPRVDPGDIDWSLMDNIQIPTNVHEMKYS